jgi:uncharacterized protein
VRIAAVGAALLVTVALAAGPDGARREPSPALVARPVARWVAAAPGGGLAAAERGAVSAVDGFWRRHFPELFHAPYRSPTVLGGYRGTNGPSCAGQPPVAFNAFYCAPRDFLAWDENLMTVGYQRVGDGWVYLIVAHEWGHAIQARLNRYLVSVATELQADCLAGASLAGAQRDGQIRLRPGDDRELGATLTALADAYPWTRQRDHGDAQQRVTAFNLGAGQGVPACLAH